MNGFLDRAFAEAERRVKQWRREDLLRRLLDAPAPRRPNHGFATSLREARPFALIAEIKRASPSQGTLRGIVNVPKQAQLYFDAGATAVSVLTESRWFGGSLDDLVVARHATSGLLLRKDFIVDEYDIEVSAAIGADAVLLIAARLSLPRLRELLSFAADSGLEALVEAHDDADAAVACESGATVIGINSRNLHTLEVDLNAGLRLLRRLSPNRVRVLESGIHSSRDVRQAAQAGANAVLVGEILMRSHDSAATIRSLLSEVGPPGTQARVGRSGV
ncbi:MAG: indole-3-glycerol-phosphate synthase [Planctomycetes bacterium]|nr:indole-3-glycerol-phosphate synthase [Planctomycetota bacterium]MBI3832929.1 indole-3-glycerol-phosphate synthase [Planctomycetota bacterium]